VDPVEDLLYNSRTSSFLGCSMQQMWADLAVWERFLNKRHIRSLIELGTGHCGMAVFLSLQCLNRGMNFLTCDIYRNSRLDDFVPELIGLGDHFMQADVFASPHLVSKLQRAERPLVLFCDNGDKPREVQTLVPMLHVGDYVAVHDWGSEIGDNDMAGLAIEPVLREECEQWASITRFWRVVG